MAFIRLFVANVRYEVTWTSLVSVVNQLGLRGYRLGEGAHGGDGWLDRDVCKDGPLLDSFVYGSLEEDLLVGEGLAEIVVPLDHV